MKPKLTYKEKPITLITIISQKSSQTLLEFLAGRFRYLSSEEWGERIREGKVKVNGLGPSEGQPLRPGDEVAYTTNSWEEPEVNKDYRVVYEDKTLLAVSKPAPLPVHAIGAYFQNTLMHLLRRDMPDARGYHLVHRLDSETSGLLLLAKTKDSLKDLLAQWDKGGVQKTYRAIVFGKLDPPHLRLDTTIGPLKGSRIRMKLGVNQNGGKLSSTELDLLETRGAYSLVEARPLTGRTHQIRVHLESLGFPIVGDKLYSGDEETFLHFMDNGWDDWLKNKVKIPRSALHAFKLEFSHPVSGEKISLEDPFTEELNKFWESAGSFA